MPTLEDPSCRPLRPSEFAKIRRLAYETFGLDLRSGKEDLVAARLGKQIRQAGCRSFDEYYHLVLTDLTGESLVNLIDALTTNHTSFFREPAHFDFLRNTFLPEWRHREVIDVWSAACSTGEEPYSIAMCLLDALGQTAPGKLRILATDISTRVLAIARLGIYPAERFEDVTALQLPRYWLCGGGDSAGSYRAKKELRAVIEFRRLNLLDPLSRLGHFPLIFCRNVLIYFDKPTQQRVVECLASVLSPGAYLLTGHAESLTGLNHGLRAVQPAVYRKPPFAAHEKGG